MAAPDRDSSARSTPWPLLALALLWLIDSVLVVAGDALPSPLYPLVLLLQPLLALALALSFAVWLARRPGDPARRAVLPLVLAALCGITYLVLGHAATAPLLPLLYAAFAALALALATWAHRATPIGRAASVLVLAAIAIVATLLGMRFFGPAAAEMTIPADFASQAMPATMADMAQGGADGPFFPAPTRTADGERLPQGALAEIEACARCHVDIADQWRDSPHRYSSLNNPWYRQTAARFEADMVAAGEIAEGEPNLRLRACAACHDPALLLTGAIDEAPVATLAERPEADAGVSCTACHAIADVPSRMGSGHYEIALPNMHEWTVADRGLKRMLHDLVVRLDPGPHKRAYLKPLHVDDAASPLFCTSCHKGHLDEPVNDYQWLSTMNDYDAWQASSISGFGARSAYYPERPMTCNDCHMPSVEAPGEPSGRSHVASHRFAASNVGVAALSGSQAQMDAVVASLQRGLTIDVFALTDLHAAPGAEPLNTLYAPLDAMPAVLAPGEDARLDVVIRSREIGHYFPGGKMDVVDAWVELTAVDDRGRTLFWSGATDADGPVDPGAYFLRMRTIDGDAEAIEHRDDWRRRGRVYVRVLLPNTSRMARYRIALPSDYDGQMVTVTARLQYREQGHTFHSWVREGAEDAPAVVPIVTLAEDVVTLGVRDPTAPHPEPPKVLRAEDWERWNDYGIGMYFNRDRRTARIAFERTTEIDPENVDGWVNIGRTSMVEGDLDTAREMLQRAEKIDPDLARTIFLLGSVARAAGDNETAATYFHRALEQYPHDRSVRNALSQLLFLLGDYAAAAEQLQHVLRIDPENRGAHYSLARAYRALGDEERAALHQQRAERVQPNPAGSALTRAYRQAHPFENALTEPIHEHVSQPLDADGQP
ncbi:MAG: tetratricopeptide repeat protein, partial [Acidobacteriota bacterium]